MPSTPPPKGKIYNDEWGTGAREGYEDRGSYRPPRSSGSSGPNPMLRTLGVLAIVGGIAWGTYIGTSSPDHFAALQQNHGPIAIVGLGLVSSILSKYLRT